MTLDLQTLHALTDRRSVSPHSSLRAFCGICNVIPALHARRALSANRCSPANKPRVLLGERMAVLAVGFLLIAMPAFRGGVTHVVAVSPEKQMCRIHARRVVAPVANAKSGGNPPTKRNQKCNAVSGSDHPGIPEYAVSSLKPASGPLVTAGVFVDLDFREESRQVLFGRARHFSKLSQHVCALLRRGVLGIASGYNPARSRHFVVEGA